MDDEVREVDGEGPTTEATAGHGQRAPLLDVGCTLPTPEGSVDPGASDHLQVGHFSYADMYPARKPSGVCGDHSGGPALPFTLERFRLY
jgi:hypothetical protein